MSPRRAAAPTEPAALTDVQRRHLRGAGQAPQVRRRNHGRSHSYQVAGERVIGVTTALGNGIPKQALTRWAAKSVAEYVTGHREVLTALTDDEVVDLLAGVPFRDRDAAAKRGTEVHDLAARLLAGEELEVPDLLRGHVDSYLRFHEEWSPQDVAVEATVVHYAHRWAGTLDWLVELDGVPGLSLVDIKTSRSGVFGESALQLAAYASAESIVVNGLEWPMPEVDQAFALWLRADGYDLTPVEIGPEVYRFFRCAQAVAARVDTLDQLVGVPLLPTRRPAIVGRTA